MTAKEKAIDIFEKYYSYKWYNGKKICSMTREASKQCAIIAVNEMIYELEQLDFNGCENVPDGYYRSVKNEIEKL